MLTFERKTLWTEDLELSWSTFWVGEVFFSLYSLIMFYTGTKICIHVDQYNLNLHAEKVQLTHHMTFVRGE